MATISSMVLSRFLTLVAAAVLATPATAQTADELIARNVEARGGAARLKAVEDALDALVCAVSAIDYMEDRAEPLGDEEAAIWLPQSSLARN